METSLTFADQDPGTTSAAQTVTLSNEGSAAQPLGEITISGDSSAFGIQGACSGSLAAFSRCTEDVTFTPPQAGAYSAVVHFTDDQGHDIGATALSGTGGTGTPNVSVVPYQISFGNIYVGDSSSSSVEVTNNGSAAITIEHATLSDDSGVFAVSGDYCTGSLAAGASCTVNLTFTPADATSYNATLTISDDHGNTVGASDLSGTGESKPNS